MYYTPKSEIAISREPSKYDLCLHYAFKKLSIVFTLLFALILGVQQLSAQTISPDRYWTFNGSNPIADSAQNYNIDFAYYQSAFHLNSGGAVGNYITLDSTTQNAGGGNLSLNSGVTVEFLFRPGYRFNNTTFISRRDGAFTIQFDYPKIKFRTKHKKSNGVEQDDIFEIELNGVGVKEFGHYIDGNWHHMVFKFN
ncbi:MAG: hypothetical protein KJO64_01805, partial [Bacteroidia bacterium]|nr:hypothetical protein [Bacteroidia bacterium]